MPIIRRNNCIYATLGTCHSLWMTVWYVAAYAPPYQTVIYFFSLHVLGDYMPIIRRNNCIYATLDTCHSLWMTDMVGGMHTSHPHTVTNTKRRIDTAISPDDGHIVVRNMYRKEINILKKTVHQFGFIYKIKLTHVK